ncbi:MAG: undecaprenyldiphospho-muramoylpentapeptide beta-N-acetylglucosaminyltransferase [Clostridiaceae bacterium]|nr:undecaprenyldiphospho-muramoylpentapeptide beta-N-acetylglucosaminyltransferase [Clostridiaceae bacterium]
MNGAVKGRRYLLAGGGTSGHVNPALAIADQLKKDDPTADIRFCGTARGIEQDIIPRAGYPFQAIRARGLPRRLSPDLFRALADFWAGRRQCRQLMREFCPDVVIGTGGYVCSPVVAAAASLHIPVLLHEQNAFPGRSNRLMARRSQMVCVSFPGTEHWFHTKAPIILTGNPVRSLFFELDRQEARKTLNLDPDERIVLAMGGSLGARSINQAVLGLSPWLDDLTQWAGGPPTVYLAAGSRQYAEIASSGRGKDWLQVRDYIHDIQLYMAAADLLVCRAGAITCSELAALGRPAVMVPYPYAAGDHQTYNARVFADAGAAILCPDAQLQPAWLAQTLHDLLLQPDRLQEMGRAAKQMARPDAVSAICRSLYGLLP